MRIKIQFENETETVSLSRFPSTFEELLKIIEEDFADNLSERWKIEYFDENLQIWSHLDEKLYKNLSGMTQSFSVEEIKFRIVGKISEESSWLVLGSELDISNQTDSNLTFRHDTTQDFQKRNHGFQESQSLKSCLVEEEKLQESKSPFLMSKLNDNERDRKILEEERGKVIHNHLQMKLRTEERTNGNQSLRNHSKDELEFLEKQLQEGLEDEDLKDVEDLKKELEKKRKELADCRADNRPKKVEKLELEVEQLEKLYSLFQQIQERKNTLFNPALGDLEELKKQLEEGLEEEDLKDIEDLRRELEKKRKELADYRANNRPKKVEKLEPEVEHLEKLLSLFQQIQERESKLFVPIKSDLEELRKQLEEGLEEEDLKDNEDLRRELEKKRKELADYRANNRPKKVEKLEPEVERLEKLHSLSEKIRNMAPNCLQRPILEEIENQSKQFDHSGSIPAKSEFSNTDTQPESENDSEKSRSKKLSEIKNLKNDFSLYPDCAEKSLLKLKYFGLLKSLNIEDLSRNGLSLPSDKTIQEELKALQERAKVEDLFIYQEIEKMKVYLDNEMWKEFETEVNTVLKKTRPLDIQELLRLIDHGKNAAALISGKNVMLFLGKTGAGKSTTIHFLAGSTMQMTEVNGKDHYGPRISRTSGLANVTTSSSSKSETRYITSVLVNLAELGSVNNGEVILCDTPGFGDTAGAEVDIANTLSIVEAIKKSKSVKPVILVSYMGNGDRFEGLKDLAHILAGMIPSIEDHMQSISYLFTKYPERKQASIYASLMSLNKELTPEELSDKAFEGLFKGLLRRAQKKVWAVNPLDKDQSIAILDDLVESSSIQRPDEVFKFSLSEKSRATLGDQVRRHQIVIVEALKRFDYDLVQWKLDQLKKLLELLGEDCVGKVYADCTRSVGKYLNQQYDEAIGPINRCLNEEKGLDQDEVEKYDSYIAHAKIADSLRKEHLDTDKTVDSSAYIQNLKTFLDKLLKLAKEKNIDDPFLKKTLDKIRLVTNVYGEMKHYYEEACETVERLFKFCEKSLKTHQDNEEFEKCGVQLTQLLNSITIFEAHWEKNKKMDRYQQLKDKLQQKVRSSTESYYPLLSRTELTDKDIESLKAWTLKLESLKIDYNLRIHMLLEEFEAIYAEFVGKLESYFNAIHAKIEDLFEKKREKSFSGIEGLFKEMDRLRKIPVIEVQTSNVYHSTLETICGFIEKLKLNVSNELSLIFQGAPSGNCEKICDYTRGLETSKWITLYKPNLYSNVLNDVEEELIKYCQSSLQKLKEMPSGMEDYKNLNEAYSLVEAVEKMESLEELFKNLSPLMKEMKNIYYDQVKDNLKESKGFLAKCESKNSAPESLNLEKIEKILEYLDACKSVKTLKGGASGVHDDFKDFLEKRRTNVNNMMENFYENIIEFRQEANALSESSPNTEKSVIFDEVLDLKNDDHGVMNESSMKESMISNLEEVKSANQGNEGRMKKKKPFLYKNIEGLALFFQELEDIENHYPKILRIFDPERKLLKEWKRKLEENSDSMTENMQEFLNAKESKSLQDQIQIAKVLSRLDNFITTKYNQIYKDYQKQFYKLVPSSLEAALKDVEDHNYKNLAWAISQWEDVESVAYKKNLTQLNYALNNSLEALIEQTKIQARFTETGGQATSDKIRQIVKNLNWIKMAGNHVENLLDPKVLNDLKECENNVKVKVEEGLIQLLHKIKGWIIKNRFDDVFEQKQIVGNICDDLGSLCGEKVLKEFKDLDELENDHLKKLQEKYEKMELKDYAMYPPKDVFERFEKFEAKFPSQKYTPIQKNIEDDIKRNFLASLNSAEENKCFDSPNTHLRNVQNAFKFLPQSLQEWLRNQIEGCEEQIQRAKSDHEEGCQRILKTGTDLQSMSAFVEKCIQEKQLSSFKQIQDHVFLIVGNLKSEILKKIDSQQIKEILPEIKNLSEFQTHLGIHFEFLSSHWSELSKFLESKFNEKISLFKPQLRNLETILTYNSDIFKEAWKAIADFSELFQKCHTQGVKFTDIFLQEKNEKFIEVNVLLSTYFEDHISQYEAAFKEFDHETLNKILKSAKIWEQILDSVRQYSMKGQEIDSSFSLLTESLKEVKTYPQIKKSIKDRFYEIKTELDNEQLINENTKGFKKQCEEFYEVLSHKLGLLLRSRFIEGLEINIQENIDLTLQNLQGKVQKVYKTAEILTKNMFEKDYFPSREDCNNLHISCSNLAAFGKYMKMNIKQFDETFENIESLFFMEFYQWIPELLRASINLENNALLLTKMKIFSLNLPLFRERIDEKINEVLTKYKREFGNPELTKLGQKLNLDKSGIGQQILSDYQCFKGFTLSLFNTKTKRHDIDYVLKYLEGNEIEKEKLSKRYKEFDEIYKGLVKLNLKPDADLRELISNTRLLIRPNAEELNKRGLNSDVVVKLPELLAHIFALWTLQNAEHYFEAKGEEDRDNYLLQPHAAQVISIFRMLGVGDKKEVLQNNLVQIGTGEGKSVTLAAMASVLALIGFEVSCVCYSQYLSERDYEAFKGLFDTLNISKDIHYGTFGKLCEEALNENGDIRQKVRDIVLKAQGNGALQIQPSKKMRILLIDEVDVFFSKDFYGRVYTPCTFLKDPTIGALTDLIWRSRKSPINLNAIKRTQEYQICVGKFGNWGSLIEEAVKNMLFDMKEYGSHDYVVKDNKIGYKEHEKISFSIFYRYKTLFAYYAEHENGKISQESLDENKNILLYCGHFSYSEIPKQFSFIMGVSGTLKTLNDAERNVIEKIYKIQKNTYAPSVFGRNNFEFIKKIQIENENDYYVSILNEIKAKLSGGKRAVLVFFESAKKLKECLESKVCREDLKEIDYLTEEADLQERDTRIKRATSAGQVTFLTKTFGRGTDFICHDQTVESNGGVHVIQTFVSEEISEEVQIQGRTARQGNHGTYSMVLLESSLEQFLIQSADIENVKNGISLIDQVFGALKIGKKHYNNVYDLIDDRRRQRFESQYIENQKFVEEASRYHKESLKFLKALESLNMQEIEEFLLSENKGASEARKSRTLILMDATYSMSQLLHKAKNTVQQMFERTCIVLKEHGIKEDSYLIQFAVYRNYNCEEGELLEFSPWETQPDNLRGFMEKIEANGGWGNEAIEVGLWHANCENERESVSQVILIGDAPANTQEEVDSKRREARGEAYWKQTKFSKKTFYSKELQQLKAKDIPVHTFYVAPFAKKNFQEIAQLTGGESKYLDINSGNGATLLTDFIVQAVLKQVGEENGIRGDALVQAYQNKFMRSYN